MGVALTALAFASDGVHLALGTEHGELLTLTLNLTLTLALALALALTLTLTRRLHRG